MLCGAAAHADEATRLKELAGKFVGDPQRGIPAMQAYLKPHLSAIPADWTLTKKPSELLDQLDAAVTKVVAPKAVNSEFGALAPLEDSGAASVLEYRIVACLLRAIAAAQGPTGPDSAAANAWVRDFYQTWRARYAPFYASKKPADRTSLVAPSHHRAIYELGVLSGRTLLAKDVPVWPFDVPHPVVTDLTGEPDGADGCPTRYSDPKPDECKEFRTMEPRGFKPYDWGDAGKDELYFGRLVCQGGAEPEVSFAFSAEPRSNLQKAAPSRIGVKLLQQQAGKKKQPLPKEVTTLGPTDFWTVHCSNMGLGESLDVSRYRCSSACPPSSLSLIPGAAVRALEQSHAAYAAKDIEHAIEFAQAALKTMPEAERLNAWLGKLLFEANHLAEAAVAYNAALKVSRRGADYRYYVLAATKDALKRPTDLLRMAEATLFYVDETNPLHAEVLCLVADGHRRLNHKPEVVNKFADEACAGGVARCCR